MYASHGSPKNTLSVAPAEFSLNTTVKSLRATVEVNVYVGTFGMPSEETRQAPATFVTFLGSEVPEDVAYV